tara:strand:- start:1606 stop:1842 length:237 start_codon:yes stop_codon:yes gene_type:complete
MKIGDLVTIRPHRVNRVEGPIGVHGDDSEENPFKELGIITDLITLLGNEYAYVWWHTYDSSLKGRPSEIIPCQYLKVV